MRSINGKSGNGNSSLKSNTNSINGDDVDKNRNLDGSKEKRNSVLIKYHDEIRRISSFHKDLMTHHSGSKMSKLQIENHNHHQTSTATNSSTTQHSSKHKAKPIMRRALSKLNRKRRRLRSRINESLKSWDDIEYAERQNSIRTIDLFKYAKLSERVAIGFGVLFMWYAASWQPISVFILAIMASIMGQYSKQVSWLQQLDNNTTNNVDTMNNFSIGGFTVGHQNQQQQLVDKPNILSDIINNSRAINNLNDPQNYHFRQLNFAASSLQTPHKSYDGYHFLAPLYSFVTPIFDFSLNEKLDNEENIKAAIHDILKHESNQFLRKSFEINGSAFVLALTQLTSFFIGMILITWAAKKQASRVKILYFKSCLQQEVTWFEAIDSASGSGSSLNALVDKYEDGIGMKLALLCYFIGHIALFSMTAFYQMFKLAAFCMPFVLVVGFIITYLSDWQAIAIGQQALFAKRSLQLAEEIIAAIRTVFAFNGHQKEITRYSISLQPVYRKSLIKHLYTALNTSLSKFSIFACFSAYCFYAMRLFPPYDDGPLNKATVLAVMRGAEVSIVNILISIPFMEALQQSKGSIARIYAAIERKSKINPSSMVGMKPNSKLWQPSISFKMVQFGYADRSGPTSRRRSTLPFLNLPGSPGSAQSLSASSKAVVNNSLSNVVAINHSEPNLGRRRQSLIDDLADELEIQRSARNQNVKVDANSSSNNNSNITTNNLNSNNNINISGNIVNSNRSSLVNNRRPSHAIKRMIGGEIDTNKSNKRILNYFNLDIRAGQSVALVGPSGSGKSTVLSLIQRLYDTTGGQILIGQHNIRDLNVAWLRNQIGVVTQEPRLFDMSIAENIRLGLCEEVDVCTNRCNNNNENSMTQNYKSYDGNDNRNGGGSSSITSGGSFSSGGSSNITSIFRAINLFNTKNNANDDLKMTNTNSYDNVTVMQQVIEAARAAGAHDFIIRLPQGYNTRVGSGGVQLSGGQKQRIAIARALIRKPKILLLDESTSALDTESEAQVQKALNEASVGRTTLIVAHRLSTIKHVDLIVVMYQGQVIECGSHEELMNRDSKPETGPAIYKRMYEDQQAMLNSVTTNDEVGALNVALKLSNQRNPSDKYDLDNKNKKLVQLPETGESKMTNQLGDISHFKECEINYDDNDDDYDDEEEEYDDYCDNCDSDNDQDNSSSSCGSSSLTLDAERPSFWQLYNFIEMPKWSSLAALVICLLAGLILPMNLIAHSYLFSAFAYSELDQIGEYLHVFGLIILSFSTFVFIVSFLQIILPGYVGEKLSIRMRVKTMDSLLNKPMFYFDMDSNSAGALCDRFNSYISNIQSIAGTRVATMLEAISTLAAGAFFGFGQNLRLSLFCLSFALLVLITTIIESRIVQRESNLQQKFDAQLAHLMADALSNIKTIASLNKETFFINKFRDIIKQREVGTGFCIVSLRTFLTSLKFVMPAMSWSASMYYGCHLLVGGQIDLQTIFIVCPVVLFAVNDTFRALVFLPELLKARKSIERLYRMNREFSPQVLQTLTLAQQLEQQNQLHLEQLAAASDLPSSQSFPSQTIAENSVDKQQPLNKLRMGSIAFSTPVNLKEVGQTAELSTCESSSPPSLPRTRPKKSISFVETISEVGDVNSSKLVSTEPDQQQQQQQQQRDKEGNRIVVNRRLSNINNLPSYMRRKSSRLNSLIPRQQARGKIEFRDVEFAYPNRPTALVLDGFSLSVAPGESVALVGGSGSGKSTCVAILEKFYDYHAGRITLDGHDLRLVESNWTRSQIGLVSQEPTLLSYTIGDNIRYGDNSRFVSMDEVVEAARTANIHDFIMSLPDQYDTELSNSAYSSSQLSGGQRQRIAIARALIRNAPILIFDEATSALDSRNESVVQDALNKARRGRTNLTIAHRLATIKDADKIAVLKDGKVVEVGKHEELLRNPDSHYRKLWERQEGALHNDSKIDEEKQVIEMSDQENNY